MMRSGSSNLSQGDDRSFFVRRSSSVVRRPSSVVARACVVASSVRPRSVGTQSINQSTRSIVPSAFSSSFSRADSRGRPVRARTHERRDGTQETTRGGRPTLNQKEDWGKKKKSRNFFLWFRKDFFSSVPARASKPNQKTTYMVINVVLIRTCT